LSPCASPSAAKPASILFHRLLHADLTKALTRPLAAD